MTQFKSDSFGTFLRDMNQFESGQTKVVQAKVPQTTEPSTDLLGILYVRKGSMPLDQLLSESEKSPLEFSRELTALKTRGLIVVKGDLQNQVCELTEAGRAILDPA